MFGQQHSKVLLQETGLMGSTVTSAPSHTQEAQPPLHGVNIDVGVNQNRSAYKLYEYHSRVASARIQKIVNRGAPGMSGDWEHMCNFSKSDALVMCRGWGTVPARRTPLRLCRNPPQNSARCSQDRVAAGSGARHGHPPGGS